MTPDELKDLITIVTGIIAIPPTIFGIPVAYLHIRKTIVEIRKIELEIAENQEKLGLKPGEFPAPLQIVVESNDQGKLNVITTDPRLLGPLSLLLNFVIVGIILILLNYVLRVGLFGFYSPVQSLMMFFVAAFLLTPILREALRTRKGLLPIKISTKEPENEKVK